MTPSTCACHGIGGMVGMIATGVFAAQVGLIYGKPTTFLVHLLALVIVGVFTFGGSLVLYKITERDPAAPSAR